MEITGQTKVFAVLGHPVAHTLSPAMHNAAFAALGLDAVYVALDVTPEQLPGALAALADLGFGGLNITVPLKEAAYRALPRLDESARLMGAVNTVQFTPEGATGHNTDGAGFLRAIEEAFGAPVAGRSLFILGCGGAGRAVALASAGAGVTKFALADLDASRARKLAMELETQFLVSEALVAETPAAVLEAARAADLVVQATPAGLKPGDASPLGVKAFRAGQWAFDLVYGSPETPFMRAAREGGAQAANGLGMLLHQGAKSFEIWTGRAAPLDVMRRALEKKGYGA
ncbi:MAG: shikimate dehydrogenase [Verrucomicrobia bacterium]|nr:shikimate dehydrogenase [Verrucomicrobiota bacterium]